VYLGERVLSKAGIEDGIRDLVTVQLLEDRMMKVIERVYRTDISQRGADLRNLIGVTLTDRLGGKEESVRRLCHAAHCELRL
jgi:hypothetical protein